jgi:hypothetical protein
MAKAKFDGIVEAVRYNPDGKVKWVRAYLRRGQTFSDIVLLDRQMLAEQLKSGKRIMAGKRIPLQASTFEVTKPLRLIQQDTQEVLVTGDMTANKDCLEGVPVI